MISLLGLLMVAHGGAVDPPPTAQRAVLEAFKAACSRTGDLGAMESDAAASGWEKVEEKVDARLERLTSRGREAVGTDAKVAGASFRKVAGARNLFLVLSRYEDESGYWGVGCRAYDFDAPAPFDAAELDAWMGRPPTGDAQHEGGIVRKTWEPGWRDGISVEASYIPAGHPLGEPFGLSGTVLVAQAIGGF